MDSVLNERGFIKCCLLMKRVIDKGVRGEVLIVVEGSSRAFHDCWDPSKGPEAPEGNLNTEGKVLKSAVIPEASVEAGLRGKDLWNLRWWWIDGWIYLWSSGAGRDGPPPPVSSLAPPLVRVSVSSPA